MAQNKDIILLDTDGTKLYPLAHKDSSENIIDTTYLKLSGGTMTGALHLVGNQSSAHNDKGLIFTNGSRLGENTNGDLGIYAGRRLILRPLAGSSSSGTDGIEINDGGLYPTNNGTEDLGTSSKTWNNVYATTYNGNLVGNVTGSSSLNVLKAGDTMTGNLTVDKSAPEVIAKDITHNGSAYFGFGSDHQNHGVYSFGYAPTSSSWTSDGKWLIYRDSSGDTCSPSLSITNDLTVAGNSIIRNHYTNSPTTTLSTSAGYAIIATFKITGTYANQPITITASSRGRANSTNMSIMWNNVNGTNPDINYFRADSYLGSYWLYKSTTSTWQLITSYSGYDWPSITDIQMGKYSVDRIQVDYTLSYLSALPTGAISPTAWPYAQADYATSSGTAITATNNVLKAGDTMTGPLIIKGNASSNPITTRGIRGSDGNGGTGDLYINYNGGGVTYFGASAGGNISADGKSYSGNSATSSGVIDAGDPSKTITMQYSGSGVTTASWFGAWDGYKLTCISAANTWTAIGGGSIGKKSSLSASDIPNLSTDKLTSGTLPISRGGTGASSAASARANLATPYMTTEDYPALLPIDGTNNWIKVGTKNTSFGLLPSQSGGAGSGHNYLGTSSWYWKYAYIDEIYGVLKKESSATGVITKVSGAWTVNSSSVTIVAGRICQLWIKLKGSGTSVSAGNNAFKGTLSSGYRPLVQQNTCQYYGDTGFICYLGTNGDFVVRVIASDRNIPSDEYNEFTFTYLI